MRQVAVTCTFGATGADVEVRIAGNTNCAANEAALASDGHRWYPISALSPAGSAGLRMARPWSRSARSPRTAR